MRYCFQYSVPHALVSGRFLESVGQIGSPMVKCGDGQNKTEPSQKLNWKKTMAVDGSHSLPLRKQDMIITRKAMDWNGQGKWLWEGQMKCGEESGRMI